MTTVTLDLLSVHCGDTEDVGWFGSQDEFYVTGGVAGDGGIAQAVLTTPIDIDDGETKSFGGQSRLWSGSLEPGQSVALFLDAYDEDAAKDWSNRPKWIDAATTKLAEGLGTSASAGIAALLASNPAGWAVLGGAVAAGLILGGFYFILSSDKDDKLGSLNVVIPAEGAPDEVRQWSFSHSDWTGYSSWSYTVSYRIRRDLPKGDKDNKDSADSKQSADTKQHKDSKDGKDHKDAKEVETKLVKESDKLRKELEKLRKEMDGPIRSLGGYPGPLNRGLVPDRPAPQGTARTFVGPNERPEVGSAAAQASFDQLRTYLDPGKEDTKG